MNSKGQAGIEYLLLLGGALLIVAIVTVTISRIPTTSINATVEGVEAIETGYSEIEIPSTEPEPEPEIACYSFIDCSEPEMTPSCDGNQYVQDWDSYDCVDPGTAASSCDVNASWTNRSDCFQCYDNGSCIDACFDSDGGIDSNATGTVTTYYALGGKDSVTDYCASELSLLEYYCSGTSLLGQNIVCPWGCIGGTCTEPAAPVLLQASWSEPSGSTDPNIMKVELQDNNMFDGVFKTNSGYWNMLTIEQDSQSDWVLRAPGTFGVHRFDRTVQEFFSPKIRAWGGKMYVNLRNLNHYSNPTDLAFAGGYTTKTSTTRNFAIGAMYYDFNFPSSPAYSDQNVYIYLRAFHNSNGAMSGLLDYDSRRSKMFTIPDANWDAFPGPGLWPDRDIKIEWFVTNNNKVFGRVDDGEWKEALSYTVLLADFETFRIGWVSSYCGGSIDFKEVELYDETAIPEWMAET